MAYVLQKHHAMQPLGSMASLSSRRNGRPCLTEADRKCQRDSRLSKMTSEIICSGRCHKHSDNVQSHTISHGNTSAAPQTPPRRSRQSNRCRSVESGLVAMDGWRTRRHETAPIDSPALFGSSFWVGDVKTGGSPALRDQLGGCPVSDRAASGVQAARSSTRLLCGT